MFAFEFLRMREMIAQLLDVAREAIGFATRMESERGEARAVAHEDVGLSFTMEAVEERALGAAGAGVPREVRRPFYNGPA
jgi:hypothetical protein